MIVGGVIRLKIETIWSSFLEEVQKQVSITSYQVWFKDLRLILMDNKKITIQVPMPTHKTILSSTYYNIIQNIFLSLTGIEYDINFILPEENNIVDNINDDIEVFDNFVNAALYVFSSSIPDKSFNFDH